MNCGFGGKIKTQSFQKLFSGGHLFVFVEYLCNRSPKIKTKNIKNYSSILAIANHRNWLDDSPPLRYRNSFLEILLGVGVAFTSDGRQGNELDTRIGKDCAVIRALCYSVVIKRELSKKAKLSIFKTAIVPILTYGQESWVTTKRVRSQVQASEMNFLQRIKGVTLFNKVHSSEIPKSLDIDRYTSLN